MNRSDKPASDLDPLAFLMGGGGMGALIRSMDWSKTSLGPVAEWPQSLRTTISICLSTDLPICVIWGPGLVQLYNDAYRVICGDKHPQSMGQNFSECWKEAWPVIGEAHDTALAGDKAFLETQHIFLERHGYLEECFFTFSFSPIRDETGRVGGLFHPVIEMTAQMLSARRTRTLRDLTAHTSKAKSISEVLAFSAQTFAEYDLDLPFVLLYALEPHGDQARLVGATGLSEDSVARLSSVCLTEVQAVWPLEAVVRSGSAVKVDDVRRRLAGASCGPNLELPNAALAVPIIPPGADRPIAIFIAGISPRLPMNEAYRSFYDSLASGVTTAVVNAGAYEDERRRAKALSELDRAKTAFFSNVSHEFRTPLTLMLGPIEDALTGSEELAPLHRERLDVVYRNGLRLLRLVNGLLDFSRIEAGRVRGAFEPTDLAEFTVDLASNFRSACEKAGLELRVDCPPLSEPVFVDRPMWEKIVLNLLSNAFKFTFEGEITVTLRQADRAAELVVRDSGTGIPGAEMSRLFERFHRVENARGRTHEGSGIGLALVQELVKLHGGTISAESETASEAERGTTFRISIPLGTEHLPPEQVVAGRIAAQPAGGASPFVQEALRWLPDAELSGDGGAEVPSVHNDLPDAALSTRRTVADLPRVLVADDNADMRRYVERLLQGQYKVEAVADGEAALAAVRRRMPDIILTDVMMPRLDGFGLLKALRCDPRTAGVPVILLSARAGEESRVEGMEVGADAYLVKPFSARELLARVGSLLQITRLRREADESIRASEERFRALVSASSDVVYRMSADWTEMRHLQGREFVSDTHEPNRSWLLKYIAPDDQPLVMAAIDAAIRSKGVFELEHRVMRVDCTPGWTFSRAIPLLDSNGEIIEWFGMASDVTPRKHAEEALRQTEGRFRTLFESMDEGFCVIEMILDADSRPADYRFLEVNPAFEKHTGLQGATGKRMLELAPDHDACWFEIYGRVAVTGEPIRFVREAKALENRWFDVYAFRLGDAASRKVALLFNDITSRKKAEHERERLVGQLREQDVRKDEFLATLAHELRNPLAPIRNGLQLMKLARNDGEAVEQARDMMERQVGHMVRLIDDLLDLSRISHGNLELKRERVELSLVVRHAVETSHPLIDQMGHDLSLAVPLVPIYIDGDLTRLSQVFSNLLNNAAKYTERGGRIRLSVKQQGSDVVVTVEDNGVGIPAHMLGKVFEIFTQVDRSLERSKGGLGIGLSLVQRLVELHGGSVQASSDGDGKGSAFVVRLPVALPLGGDRREEGEAEPVRPQSRRRILVVDDNQDAAISLAELLKIMGNETATAYDGLEALEVAAAFRPDVALLDIGMPKLNGYEVCRRIRQQSWGKSIVLFALTGWGQEDDQQRSLAAGFDAHLVKPVLFDDLEALLAGVTAAKG
ncbi:MAG: response regulator [Rhizobacter sp.]|nr:response regulator [Rhizobacter sp.]